MLLKLMSSSQLTCEVIGFIFEQLSNYNIIIMSTIAKSRDGFRKICREQELNKIKSSLRNLVIYCPQLIENQCSLCRDDRWLYGRQNINNICSVIIAIFHHSHICDYHMDIFIAKILQYIIMSPPLFGELIKNNQKQTIWIIYRKLIVLYQIFGNESVMSNPAVKSYISFNIQNRNEFIVRMMESAYSNSYYSIQIQLEESVRQYGLNRIFFAFLQSVIVKNPSLFLSYFDQFPFDYLIVNSTHERLVNIIRFIGEIIVQNHQNQQGMHLINIAYTSFKNHLRNVKGSFCKLQILESYIDLIELLLNRLNIKDEQMIYLVISKIVYQLKIVETLRKNIQNICQLILNKYPHYLTKDNTQNFQILMKFCNLPHNSSHKMPINMQVQTDKFLMQIQ